MKIILSIIAAVGLGLTVVPAFLVFSGLMTLDFHKSLMIVGMLCWFLSVPFLLKKKVN
jgi:uncharacterized membrane-anchored protein YitT (DUF2179 family)